MLVSSALANGSDRVVMSTRLSLSAEAVKGEARQRRASAGASTAATQPGDSRRPGLMHTNAPASLLRTIH